jgi:hypothetical protein
MKKTFILLLILHSFLNCKQEEINIDTNRKAPSKEEISNKKKDAAELIINEVNNNSEISNNEIKIEHLIPIKILNDKSENIYEKFGIDFTGNCYACDLAEFKIDNHKISISNVCDDQTKLNFEIINLENTANKIEIETQKYNFIFLKIHSEPIYKLNIINYDIQNDDLKISEYFTFKRSLVKFEIHDCGDFDG